MNCSHPPCLKLQLGQSDSKVTILAEAGQHIKGFAVIHFKLRTNEHISECLIKSFNMKRMAIHFVNFSHRWLMVN